MSTAFVDVMAERARQQAVEGWTPEHDDQYIHDELVRASMCYCNPIAAERSPGLWPWDANWWKPTSLRRNLVKAAALLIAEIERLDRLEKS